MDPTPVDAGQFRIGDRLAVEVQPLRIVARQAVPELDEPHQFSRLIGASQIGVGIAHDPALLLLGKEAEDAGTGLATPGQVVILQGGGIAPERDGVEVQGEGPPLGEQARGQGRDPTGEEASLMIPLGARGVLGGIRNCFKNPSGGSCSRSSPTANSGTLDGPQAVFRNGPSVAAPVRPKTASAPPPSGSCPTRCRAACAAAPSGPRSVAA